MRVHAECGFECGEEYRVEIILAALPSSILPIYYIIEAVYSINNDLKIALNFGRNEQDNSINQLQSCIFVIRHILIIWRALRFSYTDI